MQVTPDDLAGKPVVLIFVDPSDPDAALNGLARLQEVTSQAGDIQFLDLWLQRYSGYAHQISNRTCRWGQQDAAAAGGSGQDSRQGRWGQGSEAAAG